MEILGHTLEVVGELLIGLTVLRVHHRVLHEHKIDQYVFKSMKREQFFGVIGLMLIIVGYFLGTFGS